MQPHFDASARNQSRNLTDKQRLFAFQNPADKPKVENVVIATPTEYTSIDVECALEILSLFMLSICMGIKSVGSRTTKVRKGLTNSLFESLAQQVVDAGLVEETGQALIYIIPAFARFGLLPKLNSLDSASEGVSSVHIQREHYTNTKIERKPKQQSPSRQNFGTGPEKRTFSSGSKRIVIDTSPERGPPVT